MDPITYLRQFKIFNMAIFDLSFTILIVFLLHLYMWSYPYSITEKEKLNRNIAMYFISLILFIIVAIGLGTVFHYIFGIKSALSYYLGFNGKPDIWV